MATMHSEEQHDLARLAAAANPGKPANPIQATSGSKGSNRRAFGVRFSATTWTLVSATFQVSRPRFGSRPRILCGPRRSSVNIETIPKRLTRRKAK
jgi:hypothetical protein